MKITGLLLLIAGLHAAANGLGQTVTLSLKDAKVEKVFFEIRKQVKYDFFYEDGLLKNAPLVTVEVKDATLLETLDQCFKQLPFAYSLVGNIVLVKTKNSLSKNIYSNYQFNNEFDLNINVASEDGEPLVAASVILKRTGYGSQTNIYGDCILKKVKPNDLIEITFTGFEPQKLSIIDNSPLKVKMTIATNELDRAVVQAYGNTTQRFSTGNIAKITANEISRQPVMNPLLTLQNRIPGLIVTQTSGFASAPIKIELRGRNTINGSFTSDPLYIIDGVPLTIQEIVPDVSNYNAGSSGFLQNGLTGPASGQSPFFSINPNDIESIEVLKDADATAIYGSRAANGVIIITTKKAKPGRTKVDLNASYGISRITRYWDMLNTNDYIAVRKEAFKNDNITIDPGNAPDLLSWDTTRYTNWQRKMWGGLGKNSNFQVGLSGGNSYTSFRLSANYAYSTNIGRVDGSDQRGSVSLNVMHKGIDKKFYTTLNLVYSYSLSNMINFPTSAVTLSPNAPEIFDNNGRLNYSGWEPISYNFPFANLLQPYNSKTNFLNTNLSLGYRILNGLTLRTTFGFNNAEADQESLQPILSQNPQYNPTGSASFGKNSNKNWIIEPQIEYTNLVGPGRLGILLGASIQKNTTNGLLTNGYGYTNDDLLKTISNARNKEASEYFGVYRYAAIFGRIGYNINNRYLFNLAVRRDGSSNFGADNQFGNFGSLGIGWIVSEEKWFKKSLKFVSLLKIRASHGTTGGEGPAYGYLTRWGASSITYNGIIPLVPSQHANPNYKWQVNKKFESSIDLGLFEDHLLLLASYYRNRCNNQIVSYPLGSFTGFPRVVANSPADVLNHGWEFSLSSKLISSKNFKWGVSFNIGLNKNKLLSYPNIELSPYATSLVVGKSLNIIRLLHYTGVDPETGKYTFEDLNKDGNINRNQNSSQNDLYVYELAPKLAGGFGNSITFKSIELNFFFSFTKRQGRNALAGLIPGQMYNMPTIILDRWQKPGDISSIARFTTISDVSDFNYSYYSDGIYSDASFIRLQNVSISYKLPPNLFGKIKLLSCNLFVNAQNIFTITNYKGIDPETQNFGGMPPAKTIIFGILFNF